METKIIIENWTKVNTPEYHTEIKTSQIPRIGEKITFSDSNEEGNWDTDLYVIDIVHQLKENLHTIFVIISNDLECVNNFYFNNNELINEIHHIVNSKSV